MSRPPQVRRSRCLDIICASCYKTKTRIKLKGIYQIVQHYFLRPAPNAVHLLKPAEPVIRFKLLCHALFLLPSAPQACPSSHYILYQFPQDVSIRFPTKSYANKCPCGFLLKTLPHPSILPNLILRCIRKFKVGNQVVAFPMVCNFHIQPPFFVLNCFTDTNKKKYHLLLYHNICKFPFTTNEPAAYVVFQ